MYCRVGGWYRVLMITCAGLDLCCQSVRDEDVVYPVFDVFNCNCSTRRVCVCVVFAMYCLAVNF